MIRKPPYMEKAEEALIASVLNDPSKFFDSELNQEAFYDLRNRIIWKAMSDILLSGRKLDHVTVASELESTNNLEKAGGIERFLDLNDFEYSNVAFNEYVTLVKEAYSLRCQIDILSDGIDKAYNGYDVSGEIIGNMANLSLGEDVELPMHVHCERFLDDCKEGEYGKFYWWDNAWTGKLGRLKSELVILHAPRSTGKTALMLQWITKAHRMGHRTPLASIEMLKGELSSRFIAHLGQVGSFAMRSRGSVTSDEERKSLDAIYELKNLDLCIKDKDMSIDDICAWALREKQKGVDAIFIDNLLTISDGGKSFNSKPQMYDYFIKRLKGLRDQLEVPVILLAHPNSEGGIAWSKDVENIADIILYLTEVPEDGVKLKTSGKMIMPQPYSGKHILAVCQKNRNGICPFYASLNFVGSTQTFEHVEFE